MKRLIALLLLFSFDLCFGQSGGRNWTEKINCKTATTAEKTCTDSNSECLVSAKSITGPNFPLSSTTQDQLFQCRPRSANYEFSFNVTIDSDGSSAIDITYAELWKCSDGTTNDPQKCTNNYNSQLLTNAFSLTRYWCQNKKNCSFTRDDLFSHANNWKGNNELNDNTAVTDVNAVFEWQLSNDVIPQFNCTENSVPDGDNCYKVTPRGQTWSEARRWCLDQGGDLARFSDTTDFWSILKRLNAEIVNGDSSKIWFKWYTWDGEQRVVQKFDEVVDSFLCEVRENSVIANGKNPLSQCFSGIRIPWVTGLCVLPPENIGGNFIYESTQCTERCVDIFSNGTCYNWTETANANTVAYQQCPTGYDGIASWLCNSGNQWDTFYPDLSNCTKSEVSDSLNEATNNLNTNDSQTDVIKNVNGKLNNIVLISGDLLAIDKFIGKSLEYQKLWLNSTIEDPIVKEVKTKDFASALVDLLNITMGSTQAFWGLVPYPRFQLVDDIQLQVSEMQKILGGVLINGSYVSSDNNLLGIRVESFTKGSPVSNTYSSSSDPKQSLTLPTGYQNDHNFTDDPYISFVDFSPFQDLLYGDQLIRLEQMANSTYDQSITVLDTISIGAKLGNEPTSFSNGNRVQVKLVKLINKYTYNMANMKCVFWDHTIQFWNDDGCFLQNISNKPDSVYCLCDHLTNFAVIVDINGLFNGTYPRAFDYITNIGTIISIVCLAAAFLIFCFVRSLRRDFRFHIHRNLCLSLLLAEIFMLAGLGASQNQDVCLSMAIIQHFLFLCAFGWMFVEGIYLYFLITRVFDGTGFKRWQYYLIGFGLPGVVVSITMGIHFGVQDYNLYASESTYCWLNPYNGAIWAFLAPVAGVIIMNSFFLFVAIWTSLKSRRRRRSSMSSDQNKRNCQWIFGALSLTFVLGITWIFGFLFFNTDGTDYVMAYIFTTLNSFQGVIIFLTVCVFSSQVRNATLRELSSSNAYRRIFRSKSESGSGTKNHKNSQQSFGSDNQMVLRDNSFNNSDSSFPSGVSVTNYNYYSKQSNSSKTTNYNNRY